MTKDKQPTEHKDIGNGIVTAKGGWGRNDFVNGDGSWNVNNITVSAVLAKHDSKGSPLSRMAKSDESKLMADEGHRLDVADTILKLGRAQGKPVTEDEMLERLYEYFAVCQYQKVPPTYPLFAVWCGMSIDEMEKSHARLHGLKNTVALCRETIRGFLELSAMDNALSPLIYFHQQKVYFGAVETAKLQIDDGKSDDEKVDELKALVDAITKPLEAELIDVHTVED